MMDTESNQTMRPKKQFANFYPLLRQILTDLRKNSLAHFAENIFSIEMDSLQFNIRGEF